MRRIFFIFCFVMFSNFVCSTTTENSQCQIVRLADIGWSDVTSTTALTAELLTALQYEPKISLLSMPVTFASLKNNDIDVFLGNWMPTQEADIRPYLQEGSLVAMHKNLEHGRYTLAVPQYVYEKGVRSFADLQRYAGKFSKQIYGIESGNDGNRIILKMIEENAFSLGGWNIVESSEQGMLVAVKQAVARGDFIVFLGWAPHPMNLTVKMRYLEGGDRFFGPQMGDSTVYTVTRNQFAQDCPNLARFFRDLTFSVDIENEVMRLILDEHLTPKAAAQKWLGQNVKTALNWLKNSKTFTDQSGTEAFKKHLLSINNFGDAPMITKIPLGGWMESAVTYLTDHFSNQFRGFSNFTEQVIESIIYFLVAIPSALLLLVFCALAYLFHRSVGLSFLVLLSFLIIINLGLWVETLQTLVLVLSATFFSVIMGVPIGILAARKPWFYKILHPVLDLMQTIPTFVYLIPTLMLFGLGLVPGLISTVIFAVAAPIRLTYLGLKSVPFDLVEMSESFGATRLQTLLKVEIPCALPSIMAGFTQCIMLSLSMVVISALVGAEGLGTPVVRALNTVNISQGFESGLAIVILAIVLDRTFNLSRQKLETLQNVRVSS
jgi:glycine betaine/proline transport system substrate-binding protein